MEEILQSILLEIKKTNTNLELTNERLKIVEYTLDSIKGNGECRTISDLAKNINQAPTQEPEQEIPVSLISIDMAKIIEKLDYICQEIKDSTQKNIGAIENFAGKIGTHATSDSYGITGVTFSSDNGKNLDDVYDLLHKIYGTDDVTSLTNIYDLLYKINNNANTDNVCNKLDEMLEKVKYVDSIYSKIYYFVGGATTVSMKDVIDKLDEISSKFGYRTLEEVYDKLDEIYGSYSLGEIHNAITGNTGGKDLEDIYNKLDEMHGNYSIAEIHAKLDEMHGFCSMSDLQSAIERVESSIDNK